MLNLEKKVDRPEPKKWVVYYIPTENSSKIKTYIAFGDTPEEAINWVETDVKEFNADCEKYDWKPVEYFKAVSVEPHVDLWKK